MIKMYAYKTIRKCIEDQLSKGMNKFIIYPFGEIGIQVKKILNINYNIEEEFIIDNHLYKYNSNVRNIDYFRNLTCREYTVIISTLNKDLSEDLKKTLQPFFHDKQIVSLDEYLKKQEDIYHTKIGKYSYGPICKNHALIEEIGAFCSFAEGTEAVTNHPMKYITTHPLLCAGQLDEGIEIDYREKRGLAWYFNGVEPRKDIPKRRRSKIGNDVWLGRNVIITNGSNIGNGVIAGAGAVITKDIPDYAVVVGIPAKVIKYRYSIEEIRELNKIAWWTWSDELIRERYYDFYLTVDKFIKKYS